MRVRADNRLLDAPMQPLRCRECDAGVQVRKASWHQTSIQWSGDALQACLERREHSDSGVFEGCQALRESIVQAALDGTIAVLET